MHHYEDAHEILSQFEFASMLAIVEAHIVARPDLEPQILERHADRLLNASRSQVMPLSPDALKGLCFFRAKARNQFCILNWADLQYNNIRMELFMRGLINQLELPTPKGYALLNSTPCTHLWTGGRYDGVCVCAKCFEEKDVS